jgi:hypothetical protein
MSNRGKHLFEAFKTGASAQPTAAGSSTGSKPSSTQGQLPLFAARSGVSLRTSQVQLLVLAFALSVVVAFLLGRASSRGVEASGASQVPAELTSPQAQQPAASPTTTGVPPNSGASNVAADPNPRSAVEQALYDTRNVYTIKVCDYVYNDTNKDLATKAMIYLIEQHGVPACGVTFGTRLFILAGAAPSKADLEELLGRIRKLDGPPPRSKAEEFETAYPEKIDKVFNRTK